MLIKRFISGLVLLSSLLCIANCCLGSDSKEVWDKISYFSNIAAIGDRITQENGELQGLMIRVVNNYDCQIADTNGFKFKLNVEPRMYENQDGKFHKMIRNYFRFSNASYKNGTLVLNDFHSFNIDYELAIMNDTGKDCNIVFNCDKSKKHECFGDIICYDIKSVGFHGAKNLSFNDIISVRRDDINILTDNDTVVDCRKYSKRFLGRTSFSIKELPDK